MFVEKQVKSDSVDVVSTISSRVVKTIESKVESVDVKNKGVCSTIETKHVKKTSFSPPIIEDWIFDDESEVEFEPKVEDKNCNPQQKEYKEKGDIESGCSRHMTGTNDILLIMKIMMVDLFPLEMVKVEYLEKLLDESQVLLRVSRKDNIYNVDLQSVVPTRGIKREFSVARTPQHNGVAKRKNKTLIEAARTMALVIKPHNKTPYELIRARPPLIGFMKPFRCPVTILNTRNYLGKFDEKADERLFVGYYV
nr:hypothetical protein [Tanacetum cinerariifolium]